MNRPLGRFGLPLFLALTACVGGSGGGGGGGAGGPHFATSAGIDRYPRLRELILVDDSVLRLDLDSD